MPDMVWKAEEDTHQLSAISFFRLEIYDTIKIKILKNNKTYFLAYQLIYSCAGIKKHGKI